MTDGVSLLRTAEAGVYAAYDTAQIYQAEISRDQIGDVISELYIYEAFDRTSVFQKMCILRLESRPLSILFFCGCTASPSDDGCQLRLSVSEAEPCCGG